MSYLKNNNNKIIVDAILTAYGKSKLAAEGNLGIVKFAVADDEVDYALYNSSHPDGSDYYNVSIVNLPILQALPESYLAMQYPNFTRTDTIDAIITMNLSFEGTITGSGINNFNTYPITPSFVPEPGDVTRIYYVAKLAIPNPVPPPPPPPVPPVPNPQPAPILLDNPVGQTTIKTIGESSLLNQGDGMNTIGQGAQQGAGQGQNSDGAIFTLQPWINPDIGMTQAIQDARQFYRDTNQYKYAVGHGFTFKVSRLGRRQTVLPLTIKAYGINSRPRTIRIKITNKSDGR